MKIVTVIYHEEPDGWWAESPDAPSFFATGPTRTIVRQRVVEALPGIVGEELEYIDVDVGQPDGALVGVAEDKSFPGDGAWSLSGTGASFS